MRNTIALLIGIFFITSAAVFADALDTWTLVHQVPHGSYGQIVYGNGTFIAISQSHYTFSPNYVFYANYASYSSDGIHWSDLGNDMMPSGIAFGNGVFAAVSWNPENDGDSGYFYCSTNGPGITTFAPLSRGPNGQYGIASATVDGHALFVAVGHFYEGDTGTVFTSSDGLNWTQTTNAPSDVFFNGIASSGDSFLILGTPYYSSSQYLDFSEDGTNVIFTITNNGVLLQSVSFANDFYASQDVFAPTNHHASGYLVDLQHNVSLIQTNAPYPSLRITNSQGGIYLSINASNGIYTATNKYDWTLRSGALTNVFTCVTYGGNYVIACTADGSIYRSGNLRPNLAGQIMPANGGFQLSLQGGLQGQSFELQASTNLVDWTNVFKFHDVQVTNAYIDSSATNYSRRYYRTVTE